MNGKICSYYNCEQNGLEESNQKIKLFFCQEHYFMREVYNTYKKLERYGMSAFLNLFGVHSKTIFHEPLQRQNRLLDKSEKLRQFYGNLIKGGGTDEGHQTWMNQLQEKVNFSNLTARRNTMISEDPIHNVLKIKRRREIEVNNEIEEILEEAFGKVDIWGWNMQEFKEKSIPTIVKMIGFKTDSYF